jgi:hypothetical protein
MPLTLVEGAKNKLISKKSPYFWGKKPNHIIDENITIQK